MMAKRLFVLHKWNFKKEGDKKTEEKNSAS